MGTAPRRARCIGQWATTTYPDACVKTHYRPLSLAGKRPRLADKSAVGAIMHIDKFIRLAEHPPMADKSGPTGVRVRSPYPWYFVTVHNRPLRSFANNYIIHPAAMSTLYISFLSNATALQCQPRLFPCRFFLLRFFDRNCRCWDSSCSWACTDEDHRDGGDNGKG